MTNKLLHQQTSGRSFPIPMLMALALGLSLVSSQAKALDHVQCAGSSAAEFSPGLTNSKHSVAISLNEVLSCEGMGIPPQLTAVTQSKVARTLSCKTLLGGGAGRRVLNWSNGKSKTYDYISTSNLQNGNIVVVFDGRIVAGRYAGQKATATNIFKTGTAGSQPNKICSLAGVSPIFPARRIDNFPRT